MSLSNVSLVILALPTRSRPRRSEPGTPPRRRHATHNHKSRSTDGIHDFSELPPLATVPPGLVGSDTKSRVRLPNIEQSLDDGRTPTRSYPGVGRPPRLKGSGRSPPPTQERSVPVDPTRPNPRQNPNFTRLQRPKDGSKHDPPLCQPPRGAGRQSLQRGSLPSTTHPASGPYLVWPDVQLLFWLYRKRTRSYVTSPLA